VSFALPASALTTSRSRGYAHLISTDTDSQPSVDRNGAVIVAVVAVATVQMAVHEIVSVIPVRDRVVSTPGAVMVIRRVAGVKARRAARGVLGGNADRVILDATALLVLEVALRQVVDMTVVLYRRVSARGAMNVLLSRGRHGTVLR
jgi:hypothetical protein